MRSTSPVRRPVSPSIHRATSPRLHNSSLSPTSKQVRLWICIFLEQVNGLLIFVEGAASFNTVQTVHVHSGTFFAAVSYPSSFPRKQNVHLVGSKGHFFGLQSVHFNPFHLFLFQGLLNVFKLMIDGSEKCTHY